MSRVEASKSLDGEPILRLLTMQPSPPKTHQTSATAAWPEIFPEMDAEAKRKAVLASIPTYNPTPYPRDPSSSPENAEPDGQPNSPLVRSSDTKAAAEASASTGKAEILPAGTQSGTPPATWSAKLAIRLKNDSAPAELSRGVKRKRGSTSATSSSASSATVDGNVVDGNRRDDDDNEQTEEGGDGAEDQSDSQEESRVGVRRGSSQGKGRGRWPSYEGGSVMQTHLLPGEAQATRSRRSSTDRIRGH